MLGKSAVEYNGGYNLGAVPVWGLAVAAGLGRLPRFPTISFGLALLCHVGLAWPQVGPAVREDLYRDTIVRIQRAVKPEDALVVYVKGQDVDFDLVQLPNITRLYFGHDVPNAALLDERNKKGEPYVDDAGASALIGSILALIDAKLAAGHRAFVRDEVWRGDPSLPNLTKLSWSLLKRYDFAEGDPAIHLLELKKR
jgi:hypothetical protein